MSGTAMLAAAPLATAKSSAAQTPATSDPRSREQRVAATARETRRRLDYRGGRFSGPAYDWLVAQGRAATFFMLGEEHGIAENPRLAAQLFADLVPAGYSKVTIEISPPMAQELDAAVTAGGLEGLTSFLRQPGSTVAFYGMREEAEFLAAARRSLSGGKAFLWGTDYEVGADRRLIALLKARRKPAPADAALARLEAASNASWDRYAETKDPRYIYSFAGDPALVRAVRAAWPKPDARSALLLDTLEATFEINRLWTNAQRWESNERRGAWLRTNLLRHWRAEKAAGRSPRVFMKFGASHVVRGRNSTETFDMGSLVPELAEVEGGRTFSLLVLPGAGTSIAALDPATFRYKPVPAKGSYSDGLQPILEQAYSDAFTLFDTHPLRPLLGYSRTPSHPDLMRWCMASTPFSSCRAPPLRPIFEPALR